LKARWHTGGVVFVVDEQLGQKLDSKAGCPREIVYISIPG